MPSSEKTALPNLDALSQMLGPYRWRGYTLDEPVAALLEHADHEEFHRVAPYLNELIEEVLVTHRRSLVVLQLSLADVDGAAVARQLAARGCPAVPSGAGRPSCDSLYVALIDREGASRLLDPYLDEEAARELADASEEGFTVVWVMDAEVTLSTVALEQWDGDSGLTRALQAHANSTGAAGPPEDESVPPHDCQPS